jgi:hypothetical protein
MMARRIFTLLALVVAVTAVSGCVTTNRTVFEKKGTKIQLQSKRGTDLQLDHPVLIAPVRLSHVLSRIDVRMTRNNVQTREPAIPLKSLELIATALANGLREAGPEDRVVVYSIVREKRFGIFDHNYLTSFIAYVKGASLFIHLSRASWEIPPRREKNLPKPAIGKFPSRFRALPGKSMQVIDQQSLAIAWKDRIFYQPTRTRVDATGKTVRKTILLESEELFEPALEPEPEALIIPPGVSSDILRALADLEDQRRRGEISEVKYERRRREILTPEAVSP